MTRALFTIILLLLAAILWLAAARAAPGCEKEPGRRNYEPAAVAKCEAAREWFQTNGCVDCTRVDTQRRYQKDMNDTMASPCRGAPGATGGPLDIKNSTSAAYLEANDQPQPLRPRDGEANSSRTWRENAGNCFPRRDKLAAIGRKRP
jgi:hypothetical protein